MAGFFGIGNYSKPGPGVSKDEPQKHSFFLFFELYFRKFWKLIEVNMLFFVCCIPFAIPLLLVGIFKVNVTLVFYLSLVPLIGISVLIPGLTYILRNFARQEPAFLWMDFKDTIKKNWQQSLKVGIIDTVIFLAMILALNVYYHLLASNTILVIPYVICFFVTVVFTFSQFYIFVMLITFDLSLKQLYKNAVILAFAGIGHNLLIVLFCGILLLLNYIIFPVSLLLVPFLTISTFGFIIVFNVWPSINKFMMPKEDTDDTSESIFEDTGKQSK